MASPWKRRATRTLYESRWYNLRQDDLTLPGGEEITYTWVDHPGYAMIVPLLGDGRVVMERVYRHAPGRTLLECPSGGLDGEQTIEEWELDCDYEWPFASHVCIGDIITDGEVGVLDLIEVILAWGTGNLTVDLNQDGTVDVLDLVALITNWGPCD